MGPRQNSPPARRGHDHVAIHDGDVGTAPPGVRWRTCGDRRCGRRAGGARVGVPGVAARHPQPRRDRVPQPGRGDLRLAHVRRRLLPPRLPSLPVRHRRRSDRVQVPAVVAGHPGRLRGGHRRPPPGVGAGRRGDGARHVVARSGATGSRWLGTATASAVAVSPIFVSHSGTALAYLPSGGLVAAAIGATLRAARTGPRLVALAAGAGFGVLFFHRPYDALLTAIPVGVWLVWRPGATHAGGRSSTLALAAAPFVAAWLAYNRHVTGDPLQPAFSVGAPEDRFGFGPRASWAPTDPEFSWTCSTSRHGGRCEPSVGSESSRRCGSPAAWSRWPWPCSRWPAGETTGAAGCWPPPRGRSSQATPCGGAPRTRELAHRRARPAYWLGALGPVMALSWPGPRAGERPGRRSPPAEGAPRRDGGRRPGGQRRRRCGRR